MSENMKSVKVTLRGLAASQLFQMMEDIKDGNQFIILTPSKLSSWIISRYFDSAFKREKLIMRKAHFNHQGHLKEALKKASTEEELRAILAAAMKQVGKNGKRKVQAVREICG